MSKYFMKGTPAADIEQAMMSIPNFAPRRSGMMVLCRFHYRREDVDCKNCVQYRRGCRAGTCPYLAERLEAGAVSYETLVADCFDPLGGRLWARIKEMLASCHGFSFLNLGHIHRLFGYLQDAGDPNGQRSSAGWLAALYLLTAREMLWSRVRPAVGRRGLDVSAVNLRDVDIQDYILYHTAKNIVRGQLRITPAELADKKLVSDDTLRLIVNAALIARYGHEVMRAGKIGRISSQGIAPN